MRKLFAISATALVAMVAAIAVPSASAAVEFGDNCVVDEEFETPFTVFEISNPANPLPTAAPTAGVITQWKFNVVPAPVAIPMRFVVVRPLGPGSVQLIADTTQTVTGGPNTFPARVPVKAGDRLGVGAAIEEANLVCESPGSPSAIGGFIGSPGIGGTTPAIEGPAPFRVPLAALLEPDADNDGFGDETQDQCPQSATTQAACPNVTIDAFSLKGKGKVTVLVAVSSPAPVTVTGTAKLGKGKTAKLKAPTKSLTPGPIAKFKLKFPGSLKERLKELEPNRSLQLKIAAKATNVSGTTSSDSLKVKLKGEG
jgi:hypothetical protein